MKSLVSFFFTAFLFLTNAQILEMKRVDLPSFQELGIINSGDTIQLSSTGNSWQLPVQLNFSDVTNETLRFRVLTLQADTCLVDQLKVIFYPDPNFESTCINPGGNDYTTLAFSNINFANDTIILKPQGNVLCSGCSHYRYFIEINNVAIDSFDVKVCETLSLHEASLDDIEVTVFPNPAVDQLNIEMEAVDGEVEIQFINLWGEIVQTNDYTSSTIDVSSIQNGMYTLIIKNSKQVFQAKRIMIQH